MQTCPSADCRCALPEVARFCPRCGRRVRRGAFWRVALWSLIVSAVVATLFISFAASPRVSSPRLRPAATPATTDAGKQSGFFRYATPHR